MRQHLTRELNGLAVFSIASGSMISSGLFVLPGIAYESAGPAVILSYLLAAIMVLPAMLAKAELATAMPRSGGTYFFVHRSLGSLLGTFAGLANWFSLALKTAFALLGIGIFATIVWPEATETHVKLIAIGFTLFFAFLNILGTRESGWFQIALVAILLGLLGYYILGGVGQLKIDRYLPFNPHGGMEVLATAGIVFVSFGGLTKVASIAQEIHDPGKNIPRGMFAAYGIVSLLYLLAVGVTVGIMDGKALSDSATPLTDGAWIFGGSLGGILLSLAAVAAFITTGNAGIMAASRSPLAMAADNLLPPFFARLNLRRGTPVVSLLFTTTFIILSIWFLDLKNLVKTASTMMLLLFTFSNISLLVMRSSRISTYRPQFKVPFFPALPLIGIVFYLVLIADMGWGPITITLGFFVSSLVWYFAYSRSRNASQSALLLLVEGLSARQFKGQSLREELQEILIERDNIVQDRFDEMVKKAPFIDLTEPADRDKLFLILAEQLAPLLGLSIEEVKELLDKREEESTTMIHEGLAIPHIVVPGKGEFAIVIVRSREGIAFQEGKPPVKLIFALAGSADERNFHLQSLMAIAQTVKGNNFLKNWDALPTTEDLRALILLAERVRQGSI